jgi:homoaconitase/3-isopropylmalate dehydratase large subunit
MTANIVIGKKIYPDVGFIVTPASKEIFVEASNAGYLVTLTEVEAIFTCSKFVPYYGGARAIVCPRLFLF